MHVVSLVARQSGGSGGGGGGGISAGAVIGESYRHRPSCLIYRIYTRYTADTDHEGIIVGVVLALILVIGIFVRSRRHRSAPNAYFPSQQKSAFALSPTQAPQQYLPTYVPPSSPYGTQNRGGVTMPQAVYPSSGGGYYARAQPGQGEDRVRFGQVGVVRF